jgi:putative transposase
MSSAEHERLLRRARAQDAALFRYRLIGPALEEGLTTKQRGRVVRGIAGQVHAGPGGRAVQVSRKTIDTWIRAWRAGGFEALLPSERKCEPVTAEPVLAMAAALKRENMERTAAQVRRIMVASSGDAPSERTLQRHFAREDLVTPRGSTVFGRFEAEAPNVLWVADVLHGPPAGGRKAYLAAFLDDHSRFVTGYRWGWAEDSLHLAVAFRRAVAARGLPATAYVDNGACFVDETFAVTCAKLGIRISHSPPYRPEGRGKIERFFETVRGQFLVEISPDGKPAPGRKVPGSLDQLNGWFTTWVEHEYHVRVHSSTGATPLARWTAGTPRFLSAAELDAAFLWEAIRTVAVRTGTVRFQGNTYETVPELAGQAVTIRYSPFDLTQVEVLHRGTSHGHAQPHVITRHCHPKVKQAPQAVPAVTGIDYLQLLEDKRAAADGTAHSISYAGLAPGTAGHAGREETSDDQ